MYRNHLFNLIMVAMLMLAGAGCTKDATGLPGPAGPAGQAGANGTAVKSSPITGYMELYDQYSNPYPSSGSVTLSVVAGTSTVATTSDSTGSFSLGPLPPGNYSIKITKPGFDSLEIYVQHSGGDEPKFLGPVKMYQTLSTKITGQTVAFQGTGPYGNLILTTSFTGPAMTENAQRGFSFYFYHHSNVSSQIWDYSLGTQMVTNTNQLPWTLLLINLYSNSRPPFNSGDSVYVKTILTHTWDSQSYYFDFASDQSFPYPYRGDSAVISFIMP